MHFFRSIAAVLIVFGAQAFIYSQTPPKKNTASKNLPKVVQVDEISVIQLFAVKREDPKPLLINFWATWCVPCVEEFPELIKIDEKFRGKIDFITISLDDLAEINRDVPQFLSEMKAEMPAYLLYTLKESEVIGAISPDWSGGLPFTVLYDADRKIAYSRQGKVKAEVLTSEINNLLKIKTGSADKLTVKDETPGN